MDLHGPVLGGVPVAFLFVGVNVVSQGSALLLLG